MTKPYILAVDIGNTNIVLAILDRSPSLDCLYHWRINTQRNSTADELGSHLVSLLQSKNLKSNSIHACIYSSVVPSCNPIIEELAEKYLSIPKESRNTKILQVKYDLPFTYSN